ncbi:hypothetical protein GLAREA_11005 [Glarea lozoyensis ATCC 20868]|uniref:Uncharacterized protein n=1 Tax=Glarea lozoyensis (strain ATCC 20868 / MF5171) TaxID=1116229 RepID=S3DTR1_GLAL2|nr:uncharacterized protein GLAREA_11005 [Glarea lozoyensis ATCC 20868]EPE35306.1 hypothetical protein GLAREA_11005 [Glarea lozoyensis ATCC 20868]
MCFLRREACICGHKDHVTFSERCVELDSLQVGGAHKVTVLPGIIHTENICRKCTHKSMGSGNREWIARNTPPIEKQINTLARETCKCGHFGDWQIYSQDQYLHKCRLGEHSMKAIHVSSNIVWDPFVAPSGTDTIRERCFACTRASRPNAENEFWDRNSPRSRAQSARLAPPIRTAQTFDVIERRLGLADGARKANLIQKTRDIFRGSSK